MLFSQSAFFPKSHDLLNDIIFFFKFFFVFETGSCHVAQAQLELLDSSDLLTSASQVAGITGTSHHAWPPGNFQS